MRKYFRAPYEINEDIPEYEEAITSDDKVYSIAEEINLRVFGIQTMLNEAYDEIMESVEKDKTTKDKMLESHVHVETCNHKKMIGVHTYDILRNASYQTQFQYFSAYLPDRDDFIIDDDENEENNNAQSDYVRILLSLAYMKPHYIDKLFKDGLSKESIMKMSKDADHQFTADSAQNEINRVRNLVFEQRKQILDAENQ